MRDLVASIATFVFMLATFGLMLHVAVLILSGGSVTWLVAWLPFIGASAISMAVTNAPTPLWEKHNG